MSKRKQKTVIQDEQKETLFTLTFGLLSEDTKARITLNTNECSTDDHTITTPRNCCLPNFDADKCWLIDFHNFPAKWKSHMNMFFVCRKYGLRSFYSYCFAMPK